MKKKLNRRDFLRLSTIAAAGGVLGACSKEVEVTRVVEQEVEKEVPVEVTRVVEQEKIVEVPAGPEMANVTVFVHANQISEADAFAEGVLYTVHLMDYNLQENRKANVRYEPLPGGNEYDTKIRLMTNAGELGDHLIWGNWNAVYNYARDELVLPLDELMDLAGVSLDEWTPAAQSMITYDPDTKTPGKGQVWGLPYFYLPGHAFNFTNMDMLRAAGYDEPPSDDATLMDLQEIAEAIAKPGEGIFGCSYIYYGGSHNISHDHTYVSPFGGRVISEDGTQALINSPECLECYDWQREMVYGKHVMPTPDESEAMGHRGGCATGNLAMYRQGPWGAGWFTAREENVDPEVAYPLFPASYDGRENGRPGNLAGCDWFGISSLAKNPDACFDVLYWLNSYEAAIFVVEAGRTAPMPRVDALTDPILDDYPFMKASSKAGLSAEPPLRAANLREGEVSDLISQRFSTVATGETIVDQPFLDQLAEEIQQILDMPPA